MTTIRVTESREVKLTADNELEILTAEWAARYGDNEYFPEDVVRFIDDSDPRQAHRMGGAFAGKLGKVTQIGDNKSAKVLAITNRGEFYEIWVKPWEIELVEE